MATFPNRITFKVVNSSEEPIPNWPVMYYDANEKGLPPIWTNTGSTGILIIDGTIYKKVNLYVQDNSPWQIVGDVEFLMSSPSNHSTQAKATTNPELPVISVEFLPTPGRIKIKHTNDDTKIGEFSRIFYSTSPLNPAVGEVADQQDGSGNGITWSNQDPITHEWKTYAEFTNEVLTEDITYYFWMQTYNDYHSSDFSSRVSGILLSGYYVLNINDFKPDSVFEDEIGRYSYPVDIHIAKPDMASFKKLEKEMATFRLGRGENYGIPYRADRKSTRLNSSHIPLSRMPSSA